MTTRLGDTQRQSLCRWSAATVEEQPLALAASCCLVSLATTAVADFFLSIFLWQAKPADKFSISSSLVSVQLAILRRAKWQAMNGGSRAGNFHPLRRWEWGVRRRAPIRRVRMPHLLPYCEAQGPGDWGFLADPSAALMAGRNLKKYISRENYNILIRKIAKIIELFNNLSSHSQQQLFGTEFCSKSKLGMGAFSKLLSNTRSFLLGEHTDWTRGVILIGGLEMYELEAPDWLKYLTFRGIRETLLEDFDSSWINYNRFWIRIMNKKMFL